MDNDKKISSVPEGNFRVHATVPNSSLCFKFRKFHCSKGIKNRNRGTYSHLTFVEREVHHSAVRKDNVQFFHPMSWGL